jgi:methyl-accepting chemotaxis protein
MSLIQINNLKSQLTDYVEDTLGGVNNVLNRKIDTVNDLTTGSKYITYNRMDNILNVNATNLATTIASINAKYDTIVDGAPDVLNTLKELADAIGNDQNYASNLLTILEKTTTEGTTKTNIYTNDMLQIKVKGSTDSQLPIYPKQRSTYEDSYLYKTHQEIK